MKNKQIPEKAENFKAFLSLFFPAISAWLLYEAHNKKKGLPARLAEKKSPFVIRLLLGKKTKPEV